MANCIVASCNRTGGDLFSSPEDKKTLRKWQSILKTKETDFLICGAHFESRFIASDRYLIQDGYPSVFIDNKKDTEFSDEKNSDEADMCPLCLKASAEIKHLLSTELRELINNVEARIQARTRNCSISLRLT